MNANKCYLGIIRPQILVVSFSSDEVRNRDSGRKRSSFWLLAFPKHRAP